jgi:hypothetical protein
MSRVIVIEFMSLDGVMQDPDGNEGTPHGGWAFRFPAANPRKQTHAGWAGPQTGPPGPIATLRDALYLPDVSNRYIGRRLAPVRLTRELR